MKKWTLRTLFLLVSIGLIYYFYPETDLSTDTTIDKLIVIKSERNMEAYSSGQLIKTYKFSLGQNPPSRLKRQSAGRYLPSPLHPTTSYAKPLAVIGPSQFGHLTVDTLLAKISQGDK